MEKEVSPYDGIDTNKQDVEVTTSSEPKLKQYPIPTENKSDEVTKKDNIDDNFGIDAEDDEKNKPLVTARHLTEEDCKVELQDREITKIKPIVEKKVIDPDENLDTTLVMVRGTARSVLSAIEKNLQPEMFETNPELINWFKLLENARNNFMLSNDQLFEATIRKGSCWVNMVNCEDDNEKRQQLRGIVSDKKGTIPTDKNNTTAVALTKMLNSLGLGLPSYVPLWHSGIWLKIKTPTAAAFMRLDETLTSEKLNYGTKTRGEVFNNESVILRSHIVDFILQHVEWSSVGSTDPDYLKSIIKITDIDQLMLGMAQARYPDGYNYAHICNIDPSKCTHVVEGIIDLRELSHTDKNKLTPKQKRIMMRLNQIIDENTLNEYQEEFKLTTNTKIYLTMDEGVKDNVSLGIEDNTNFSGVVLNIEPPSLELDEEYGKRWVNELITNAEELFREKHSESQRRERIEQEVLMSYFKTYGAWIKSIEILDNGNVVNSFAESDDLNDIFEYLSSDLRLVEIFTKRIRQYIIDNVVTVVGILNYECPNCGGKHDTPKGNHHIVLPIDMLYTFFTQTRSAVRRSFHRSNI